MKTTLITPRQIESVFEKADRRFVTLKKLATALPAQDRRMMGLNDKADIKTIKAALGDLSEPYRLVRGQWTYLVGAPLPELILVEVRRKPGRTIGQMAPVLPAVKKDIVRTVNDLLDRGLLKAGVNDDFKLKLFPVETGPATDPTEGSVESPEETFKRVFDRVGKGKKLVYIYLIRRALNWAREQFDQTLDDLMVRGLAAGYPADPGRLTEDQVKDSFSGRDGELYVAIEWRKPL